ncbi:polyketide synthase docking domain-containing protein, partial [Streptomyces sp. NPDC002561]
MPGRLERVRPVGNTEEKFREYLKRATADLRQA